jgi:hypothetical protein
MQGNHPNREVSTVVNHVTWATSILRMVEEHIQTQLVYVTVINIPAPHHVSTAHPLSPKG